MRKKDARAQQDEELLRITAQYVAEVQGGRRPLLSDYLARYPLYADAIADFAAYYHAAESDLPESLDRPEPLSAISQRAMERLKTRSTQAEPEVASLQPLTSLLMAKGKQRLSPSRLAQATGLSEDVLWQLERGRIDVRTIPFELQYRLAQALQQSPLAIRSFFTQERQLSARESQRRVAEEQTPYQPGDSRETIAPKSFRRALEESAHLSPEQKASWFAILREEAL